jgi:hypothetical protein
MVDEGAVGAVGEGTVGEGPAGEGTGDEGPGSAGPSLRGRSDVERAVDPSDESDPAAPTDPALPGRLEDAPRAGDGDAPPSDLATRAARGERDAMEAIASKSPAERTATEAVALARGRIAERVRALGALQNDLSERPITEHDDPRVSDLRGFIADRDTAITALSIAASLPSGVGPDLVYDTWVGTPERSETTWLAEQLVYTASVKQHATEALSVALDLRRAEEDCEATAELLPRAAKHGDARSARLLKRLLSKRGCGDTGREDCYACLRPLDRQKGAVSVRTALARVRTRTAPRWP